MKKLIIASLLTVFSFNSFAQFSLSCPEIYQKTFNHKEIKKERASDLSQNFSTASLLGLVALPEIGLALIGASLVSGTYSVIPSTEARVLSLVDEGSRQLRRLTKKLQKNVNKDISEQEVLAVIQQGLESGLFCQNFPDLYNARQVKKHVTNVMRSNYSGRD
jgi:hypothetical protein